MTDQPSGETRSFFKQNANKVGHSVLTLRKGVTKELLVAFLTIKQYRDLLFNPKTHLRHDITLDFINHVMIPDFGTILITLRDFTDEDRRGIPEAYNHLRFALKELYDATNNKDLVYAALECRDLLHSAYQQLEHLNNIAKDLKW